MHVLAFHECFNLMPGGNVIWKVVDGKFQVSNGQLKNFKQRRYDCSEFQFYHQVCNMWDFLGTKFVYSKKIWQKKCYNGLKFHGRGQLSPWHFWWCHYVISDVRICTVHICPFILCTSKVYQSFHFALSIFATKCWECLHFFVWDRYVKAEPVFAV